MTLFSHSIILGSILYSIIPEVNFVLKIFLFPYRGMQEIRKFYNRHSTDGNLLLHMTMGLQISGEIIKFSTTNIQKID